MRRPVCLEQSERGGEREEERAGRGRGRSRRALWAMGRTRAFTPREVGVLEGWGKGGAGPYSGTHRLPLVAAAGRTDCRWPGQEPGTRVEASELVQVGNDGGWTR